MVVRHVERPRVSLQRLASAKYENGFTPERIWNQPQICGQKKPLLLVSWWEASSVVEEQRSPLAESLGSPGWQWLITSAESGSPLAFTSRIRKPLWMSFSALSQRLIMTLLSHQLYHMPTCRDKKDGAVAVPRPTMRGTDIKTHYKVNCICGTVQRTI